MNASPENEEGAKDPGSMIQIRWVEIANQVRLKLEARLVGMVDLTTGECLELVKAFREALYLETAALSFDSSADKQNEQWS